MNLLKRTKKNGQLATAGVPRFDLFRDEIDRAIERAWQTFGGDPWASLRTLEVWPPLDVNETDEGVTIAADVPGLGAKDVEVELSGNLLTLRGAREEKREQEEKGVRRYERHFGRFERSVTLPAYVDPEKVEAKYEKGTLTIKVPKIPGKGPKRVKIEST